MEAAAESNQLPYEFTSISLAPAASAQDRLAVVHREMLGVVGRCTAGPLQGICLEHLATAGKQFRARLVLDALEALGHSWQRGVAFAAACELMHNASLVHDDLQDGDGMRRGRPAVWALHGAHQAVNAGDLLLMAPFLALENAQYSPSLRWQLAQVIARRGALTACGQSLEQHSLEQWTRPGSGWASWDVYDRACVGKTGQFFALPVEGAAILAGVAPNSARNLGEAVLPLGLLFQLRDDVIDLYGDKGRGLPGNDIREGKLSALVVAHLERAPQDTAEVASILRLPREETTTSQVQCLAARFRASGALMDVVERGRALVAALSETEALGGYPRLHAALLLLARKWQAELDATIDSLAMRTRAFARTSRPAHHSIAMAAASSVGQGETL